MDDKFKELKPIDKDGKRMRKKDKCANPKCHGDKVDVRACKCDTCKDANPKVGYRFWCENCICKGCWECFPNNEKVCKHCHGSRDGEPGEGTIGEQSFSELFARFEKNQSTITSGDIEKHLETFQLNEAQTDASNVEIYQPSICSDALKKTQKLVNKEAEKSEKVQDLIDAARKHAYSCQDEIVYASTDDDNCVKSMGDAVDAFAVEYCGDDDFFNGIVPGAEILELKKELEPSFRDAYLETEKKKIAELMDAIRNKLRTKKNAIVLASNDEHECVE
eukprot:UN24208